VYVGAKKALYKILFLSFIPSPWLRPWTRLLLSKTCGVPTVGWSTVGRSDRRPDDVRATCHLVALTISLVVGADHVEPLTSHCLQLPADRPHTRTHE